MRLNKQQIESTQFLTREVATYLRDLKKQIEKQEPDVTISSHKLMLAMVGGVATVLQDFQNILNLYCIATGTVPKEWLRFRAIEPMDNYFELFAKYLLDGKRVEAPTPKEGAV